MQHPEDNPLIRFIAWTSATIIALVPFHAFLTVWAASAAGHYTALRLWKEVLLLLAAMAVALLGFMRPELRRRVARDRLLWLVGIYLLFLLVGGLAAWRLGTVSPKAMLYGVLLDGRYVVFFVVAWAVSQYSDMLVALWRKLLLLPAALTVVFGVLQSSVLPHDILRHFGYGPATIDPTETIDQKTAYTRVQSTLRGANPFGTYLVVVISAVAQQLLRVRAGRAVNGIFFLLCLWALFFSFSRGAWIGVLTALVAAVVYAVRSPKARRLLALGVAIAILVFIGTLVALRHNDRFQNIVFHTSNTSRSAQSSNAGHVSALVGGLKDIVRQPLGKGPGTAGPASVYNKDAPRIAENYYVQIGQEIGIVGLMVYVALSALVVRRLWQRRSHELAAVLLASFVGLVAVNMVSHAWTDDTLAYIWWGLAGAAIGGIRGVAVEDE